MIARILCHARCHLGEGAAFDAATGTAWWFDILERRLFEARIATGKVTEYALPVMASALATLDEERQVIAAEDGLYLRTRSSGSMQLLHGLGGSAVRLRSNDGRVHPSGTFWFSMMGRGVETGAGSIHALHQGRVHLLFPGITIPNAICFTPDGLTGFFADTASNVLCRVPLHRLTGLPAGPPVPVPLAELGTGGLDGAVIDAEGLLWVARWGGARVDAFTQGGDRARSVSLPALQPSCPVFVGPALDTLLVTSATEGMVPAARQADPDGGKTFLIDAGTVGLPEPRIHLEP